MAVFIMIYELQFSRNDRQQLLWNSFFLPCRVLSHLVGLDVNKGPAKPSMTQPSV